MLMVMSSIQPKLGEGRGRGFFRRYWSRVRPDDSVSKFCLAL
jgi:hypothetical protein